MASLAHAGEDVPKLQAKLKKRWAQVTCLATIRERAEQEVAVDRAWFELMKCFDEEGDQASLTEEGDSSLPVDERAWLELMKCIDEEGDETSPDEECDSVLPFDEAPPTEELECASVHSD